jgi:hypothetical protein
LEVLYSELQGKCIYLTPIRCALFTPVSILNAKGISAPLLFEYRATKISKVTFSKVSRSVAHELPLDIEMYVISSNCEIGICNIIVNLPVTLHRRVNPNAGLRMYKHHQFCCVKLLNKISD